MRTNSAMPHPAARLMFFNIQFSTNFQTSPFEEAKMTNQIKKFSRTSYFMTLIITILVCAAPPAANAQTRKSIPPTGTGNPLRELVSGYYFASLATRALQDDDFDNPSSLWLDVGQNLWKKADGQAAKSCASCHGDAKDGLKGVGTRYPAYDKKAKTVINLEQRINLCRVSHMKAAPWGYESKELLSITSHIKQFSRGLPVAVKIDGPAQASFKRGKSFYYQRRGQLNMNCAQCHELSYGNRIRSDLLSQGHSNGFPTYRLKWQKVGSLHRRFKGCNKQVRAEPYKSGSREYVDLELYLAWRGNGLNVETPAVRR